MAALYFTQLKTTIRLNGMQKATLQANAFYCTTAGKQQTKQQTLSFFAQHYL